MPPWSAVSDDDLSDDRPGALIVDDDPGSEARYRWRRRNATEMAISGVLGLFTSFVLSIEAWRIAADPDLELGCDINAVISCGTVARTWQANLLGFPNAFLGIAFEVVVITISIAAIGRVRFPRWFMLGTQALYTIALFFAYWLFLQAYFDIGVLCPWCLLITITTTLVFAGLTRWNIRDGNLNVGRWARELVASGTDWYFTIAWLVLFAAMVLFKYGPSLLA
ncbi:vitamin K epoxide reductase family protein [Cellulomonas denverensis]|uniref:Vitamin K epoxide reductase family protein n=1 Tax=Cellulomonas denverensis TaxID=264297 RepID=A0A7X6QXM6_9CELL|nr:vitamin K epoxide reductase family protein [Cellulomonas denverensis]